MCLNLANMMTLFLAGTIITYTSDFARNSRILPYFSSKVKTFYPPIYKPMINKRVQKILREKAGLKSGFLIGVAARLAAEKGIEYLLESIPAINSKLKTQISKPKGNIYRKDEPIFKIVIAGSMDPVGEKNYKEKIINSVKKYKEYVVFLGELTDAEMGAFYSLLDVLVLPSVNSTEAFGMVQVEAMMMGVPVVATNLPGVRVPVNRTGMGIVVSPRDSEKLAEAIFEIISQRSKFMKHKKFIEDEFSADKTFKFYKELIGS